MLTRNLLHITNMTWYLYLQLRRTNEALKDLRAVCMLIGEGKSNDFWRKQGEGQKSTKLLKICVPGN